MATLDLTAETFWETTKSHDLVLVDFWAGWCGPCMRFGPVYEAVAQRHPDVVFAKVDTEAQQALAAAARIQSIPTLFVFRGGMLVFSQAGALPELALEALIAAVRDLDMDEVRRQLAAEGSSTQS
ncbi:MAG: thioredoxin [Actinomycetota bacterium]